jgi:hypothetical protein
MRARAAIAASCHLGHLGGREIVRCPHAIKEAHRGSMGQSGPVEVLGSAETL